MAGRRWLLVVGAITLAACGGTSRQDTGADGRLVDGAGDARLADEGPDETIDAGPGSDPGQDPGATGELDGGNDGAPDAAREDANADPDPDLATPDDDGSEGDGSVAVTCEAFDTAACADAGPAGGTCLPEDGGLFACVPAGVAGAGVPCAVGALEPAQACAAGLACVEGACAAPCHRADPDCPSGQWCRGAWGSAPELGVCFARACTPYEPAGCGAADLSCLPAADGTGSCQPAGAKQTGDACGTGVGLCADGLTCLLEGPAGGRCVPFCAPGAGGGEPGACPGQGLACVDLGIPSFGVCLSACDPWSPPCPEGQGCAPQCPAGQACAPVGPTLGACYATGAAPVGADCAKAGAWWACAPGASCTAPAADVQATCARTCRPFGPASDCPDPGSFCALRKTWLGTCEVDALNKAAGQPCAPSGAWCGPNVRCQDLGAGPTCLAYCRMDTPGDCPNGTACLQVYGADANLGICF